MKLYSSKSDMSSRPLRRDPAKLWLLNIFRAVRAQKKMISFSSFFSWVPDQVRDDRWGGLRAPCHPVLHAGIGSLLIVILISCFATSALAKAPASDTLTEGQKNQVRQIEDYFNNISTYVSDFIQVTADGQSSNGSFFLKRPGFLRWQYNPPVPVIIVANNRLVTYYDVELDQVSYTPVGSTPLSLLTAKKIKLLGHKDVTITHVKHEANTLRLSLDYRHGEYKGSMTMVFQARPLSLLQLQVRDSSGNENQVSFTAPTYGKPLDEKLFIVENPGLKKLRQHK